MKSIERRIAELEQVVRGAVKIKRSNPIACRVYQGTSQTLANNTLTAITFGNERWDEHNMHDNSTNPSRIYVPVAGWYYIWGEVGFAANATGFRDVFFRIDGSTYIGGSRSANQGGSDYADVSASTLYYLTAGQYVELMARQNSGGDLGTSTGLANRAQEFAVIKVG